MSRARKFLFGLIFLCSPLALYAIFSHFARLPLNNRLIQAVKDNNVEEVRVLLDQGADINCHDQTRFQSRRDLYPPRTLRTPLMLSMWLKQGGRNGPLDDTIFQLLLKRGANPNVRDYEGTCPVQYAVGRGQLQLVKALFEHGADINTQDEMGDTSLVLATRLERLDVVRYLLEHGAKVNVRGQFGRTPLNNLAGHSNNLALTRLLLSHGADTSIADRKGATPLHNTVKYGQIEQVKLLLSAGADPNATDNEGKKPLGFVQEYERMCNLQRRTNTKSISTAQALRQLLQPVTRKN